jgi:hypothetical protein
MVFEVQGRGSLHLHALLWASLSPSLLERVAHVPDLVAEVQTVLNSMVLAEVSLSGYIDCNQGSLNNEVYRGELEPCPPFTNSTKFKQRLESVITTVNIHHHRPTCHNSKSGIIGCRFCFPQSIVENGPRPIQLEIDNQHHVTGKEETIDPPTIANDCDEYYPIQAKDCRTIVWELKRSTLCGHEIHLNFLLRSIKMKMKTLSPLTK